MALTIVAGAVLSMPSVSTKEQQRRNRRVCFHWLRSSLIITGCFYKIQLLSSSVISRIADHLILSIYLKSMLFEVFFSFVQVPC